MALYIAIATSRRSAGCMVCKELKSLRVLYKFVHVMLRMRILDPERRRIALVFIMGGARCAAGRPTRRASAVITHAHAGRSNVDINNNIIVHVVYTISQYRSQLNQGALKVQISFEV